MLSPDAGQGAQRLRSRRVHDPAHSGDGESALLQGVHHQTEVRLLSREHSGTGHLAATAIRTELRREASNTSLFSGASDASDSL